MALLQKIQQTLAGIDPNSISKSRIELLSPLASYIQSKVATNEAIRLNFICTHNSRRSHLSQVWAQAMAYHFGIKNVFCYSGGTAATALFPKAAETLEGSGFQITQLSEGENPIYSIKFAENELPVMGFSKRYDDPFNPSSVFGAIMTCSSADQECPIVMGAEARFPITYEDPKAFDNSPLQASSYAERSLQIATELYFVFSQIRLNS